MRERLSEKLDIHYATVSNEDGKFFVTEDGILFTESEGVDLPKQEVLDLYAARQKEEVFYDYKKALDNELLPIIRARQEDKGPKIVSRVSLPTGDKEKRDYLVASIRLISLVIGLSASVLSTYYTALFLMEDTTPVLAFLLSFTMIVFASYAIESGVFLWHNKHYIISTFTFVLFLFIITFSMSSTIVVKYNNFNTRQDEIVEEMVSSDTALSELYQSQIDAEQKIIDETLSQIASYEGTDIWATINLTKKNEDAMERKRVAEEKMVGLLIEKESEVKENAYLFLSRITGWRSDMIQFVLYMLPAVFIDLIAPFGIAVAVLLGKRRRFG